VALLVVVAEAVGGVPGTTHPVRQFAALGRCSSSCSL